MCTCVTCLCDQESSALDKTFPKLDRNGKIRVFRCPRAMVTTEK